METLGAAWNALRVMVSRAKVTAAASGTVRTALQATGYDGENYDGVALVLPYGMSAIPDSGDILVFRIGGRADHKVAMSADNPALRISDLGGGEFGFRDLRGNQVVFRTDQIEVTAGAGMPIKMTSDQYVLVTTPELRCTGDIIDNYGGSNSQTMAQSRATFNGHDHDIKNVATGSATVTTQVPNQLED